MTTFAPCAIVAALLPFMANVALAQPSTTSSVAEDNRMLPYAQPGRLVDIGGRRINLYCMGSGGPTVILMAGIFSWSLIWYKSQPVIASNFNDTFLFGRLLERGGQIAEVELYENRSRGQGGFQYGAAGPANLPVEWGQQVDKSRRPARAQLATLARSIFDASVNSPEASVDCVLMENGKVQGMQLLVNVGAPGAHLPWLQTP